MTKNISKISCAVIFLLSFIFYLPAFSQEIEDQSETITLVTYYPAPIGIYKELRSKKMAIGNTYFDPAQYCFTDSGTCVSTDNQFSAGTDLVVEGKVGIGTDNPKSNLWIHEDGSTGGQYITADISTGVFDPMPSNPGFTNYPIGLGVRVTDFDTPMPGAVAAMGAILSGDADPSNVTRGFLAMGGWSSPNSPQGSSTIGVLGVANDQPGSIGIYSFLGADINDSINGTTTYISHKDTSGQYWSGYFRGNVYIRDNVGIGTTNPQAKLHIETDSSNHENITITNTSYPTRSIRLKIDSNENSSIELNGKNPYIDFSNDVGEDYDVRIYLSKDDNLWIDGGNVGIGTYYPAELLEVNGTAKINTSLEVPLIKAPTGGNVIIEIGN